MYAGGHINTSVGSAGGVWIGSNGPKGLVNGGNISLIAGWNYEHGDSGLNSRRQHQCAGCQ